MNRFWMQRGYWPGCILSLSEFDGHPCRQRFLSKPAGVGIYDAVPAPLAPPNRISSPTKTTPSFMLFAEIQGYDPLFARYLRHSRATASHLSASCRIWEPDATYIRPTLHVLHGVRLRSSVN